MSKDVMRSAEFLMRPFKFSRHRPNPCFILLSNVFEKEYIQFIVWHPEREKSEEAVKR